MSNRNLFLTPGTTSIVVECLDGSLIVRKDGNRYDVRLKPLPSSVDPATLGDLAYLNAADYATQILNRPDLTLWAKWDQLGDLATKTQVDWNLDVLNRPDLTIYEVKGNLKALAYKDTISYSEVLETPLLTDYLQKTEAIMQYQPLFNTGVTLSITADVLDATGTFNKSIQPNFSSTYDLGQSNLKWKTIYCDSIEAGNLGALAYQDTVDWDTDVTNKPTPPDLSGYQPLHTVLTDLSSTTPTVNGTLRCTHLNPNTANTGYLGSSSLYWGKLYVNEILFNNSLPKIWGNPYPGADGAYVFGSSTNRWFNIYTKNLDFSGNLTGNIYPNVKPLLVAGSGITLTADDTNKTITISGTTPDLSGYQPLHATLTDLSSTAPKMQYPLWVRNLTPAISSNYYLGSSAYYWRALYLMDLYPHSSGRVQGNLIPGSNNTYALGSSTNRWTTVYADNLDLGATGKIIGGDLYDNIKTKLVGSQGITVTADDATKQIVVSGSSGNVGVDLGSTSVYGKLPVAKMDLTLLQLVSMTRTVAVTSGQQVTNTTTAERTLPEGNFSTYTKTVNGLTMTVSASSELSATYAAYRAFYGTPFGNAYTWQSGNQYKMRREGDDVCYPLPGNAPEYLQVQLSSPVIWKSVAYYGDGNSNSAWWWMQTRGTQVHASNDGVNWTFLVEDLPMARTGTLASSTMPRDIYLPATTTKYTHLRLTVTSTWANQNQDIDQLQNVLVKELLIKVDYTTTTTTTVNTTTNVDQSVASLTNPVLNKALLIQPALTDATLTGTTTIGETTFSDGSLELRGNRTDAGPVLIDFHAQPGTDYDGRVIRTSGANGNMEIRNQGIGYISLLSGGLIYMETAMPDPHHAVTVRNLSSAGNCTTNYLRSDGTTALVVGTTNATNSWQSHASFLYSTNNLWIRAPNRAISIEAANMNPINDNATNLGYPGYRWSNCYVASGVVSTSDEHEKQDLTPLEGGLALIERLQPITFRFKEGDQKLRMGLGARATQATLDAMGWEDSSLVDTAEDAPWGMNYSELIAPLIKAVQELSQQVTALRSRVQELESKTVRLPLKTKG